MPLPSPLHLRKRVGSPRSAPSPKALPHHSGGAYDKQRRRRRGYSPIVWVAAAALLLLPALLGLGCGFGRAYRYFVPVRVPTANARILPSIETLSNVPLGFSVDIPSLEGVEVYLDSRLIAAVPAEEDDDGDDGHAASAPSPLKVGTCDIGDHGENPLSHAFSLGSLENVNSMLLQPGAHEIAIEHRKGDKLTPYGRIEVKVDSPPELVVPGSFFSASSPYVSAYNLAIKEMGNNIACNHFVAGTGWSQLWTRDTSFAAELGAALVHPAVVKQSLMASVEKEDGGKSVWLQDRCGRFGGWPNLSDAIVGVRGAWSLYLATGDKEMLSWAYDVTKNSLERAEREVFEHHSGLFKGCSSFLESNSGYPEKYENDGERVGKTKALSTNMLYYAGYNLGSKMGRELGDGDETIRQLEEKGKRLKEAIQKRLWSSKKSNYAYFEDERSELVDTVEGLGISLAMLDFAEDDERNKQIMESTHTTNYGITCLWPQFKYRRNFMEWRIPRHYHNGRLWPFVQGYWAMAVAEQKRADLFTHELKGLTALAQESKTFAEFYQLNGTYAEERRSQLWSATGYLSMIYHGVFGIRLGLDGIRFSPLKPKELFGSQPIIHLNNLRYRGTVMHIHLRGQGTTVASFELNKEKQGEPFIKSGAVGTFDVDISLV